MGKNGKKRKREQKRLQEEKNTSFKNSTSGQQYPLATLGDEEDAPTDVDIEITLSTLQHLAGRPALFATKPYKSLRAALDPFVQIQIRKYDPVDYLARITTALQSNNWDSALLGLMGARERSQVPKQVAASSSEDVIREITRFEDAVLAKDSEIPTVTVDPVYGSGMEIRRFKSWNPEPIATKQHEHRPISTKQMLEGQYIRQSFSIDRFRAKTTNCDDADAADDDHVPLAEQFTIILEEKANERQPPNHHDLKMYCCESCTGPYGVTLSPLSDIAHHVERRNVPTVPGAFVIMNLLTPLECQQIVRTAEAMGYDPDHPTSRPTPTGIDACEWLADEASLVTPLFERIRAHLPQQLQGHRLAGINARWRLFRYAPGCTYRPHVDGSWPGSGRDPGTGEYVHDVWRDRRSRLTFLVYLNEDFTGGSTTFYLPPARQVAQADGAKGVAVGVGEAANTNGGVLEARSVQPRQGSVLCFLQGNSASLVHEGSAVHSGVKYVIRSDVLYMHDQKTRN